MDKRPIRPGDRVKVLSGRHAHRTGKVLEQQQSFSTGKPLKQWVVTVDLARGCKELAYVRELDLEAEQR